MKYIAIKSGTLLKTTLFILLLNGCTVEKQTNLSGFIGPNEFVFIEYYLTQEGEVLSGTPPRGMRIDGPTYRFDKETKQLDIRRKDNLLRDSIKILLGNGKILKGSAGSGISFRLTNITNLPYTNNQLTINKIDKNRIYFTFDKQKYTLKTIDEWQSSTTRIDTIKTVEPTIIKTKFTYTLRYHGKLNKKSITGI
ncbi:MAG: hypothetical protein HOO91_08850 [Bacteroidales bacterium]|nr:hypothetical protein [Bacteroidales bacterium]